MSKSAQERRRLVDEQLDRCYHDVHGWLIKFRESRDRHITDVDAMRMVRLWADTWLRLWEEMQKRVTVD